MVCENELENEVLKQKSLSESEGRNSKMVLSALIRVCKQVERLIMWYLEVLKCAKDGEASWAENNMPHNPIKNCVSIQVSSYTGNRNSL